MKVGFIGLGIMGKPMAKNLLKAGHQVCVNDFHKEAVEELVAAGATAGANNAEVAKGVDVVITMVPNSPNVLRSRISTGFNLSILFTWKVLGRLSQMFRLGFPTVINEIMLQYIVC